LAAAAVLAAVNVLVRTWPTTSDGFKLTLQIASPRGEYKLGDEIPIIFTIKNNGRGRFPKDKHWMENLPWVWRNQEAVSVLHRLKLEARDEKGRLCQSPGLAALSESLAAVRSIELDRGESCQRTIAVNAQVLMSKPGTYAITGSLVNTRVLGPEYAIAHSEETKIVVVGRTNNEMAEYLEKLVEEFRTAKSSAARDLAIRHLVYTRDSRAVPILLDVEYAGTAPSLTEAAFSWYLPIAEETRDMIWASAKEQGLTESILFALRRFGCDDAEIEHLILRSLASENQRAVWAGLLGAVDFPNDSYTALLVELAKGGELRIRYRAMRALACNRTEEGVKTLRETLESSDEDIVKAARNAIWTAYWASSHKNEVMDYGLSLNIGDMRDPNRPKDWLSMNLLVEQLSEEEFAAVRVVADCPDANGRTNERVEIVKLITELLNDADKDVRDMTKTAIRTARPACSGQSLKPDDFPEIYEEVKKMQAREER
jgi:HEAT repeat protein